MGDKVRKGQNDSGSTYACKTVMFNWEEEKKMKTNTSLLEYGSWNIYYYSLINGYPGSV